MVMFLLMCGLTSDLLERVKDSTPKWLVAHETPPAHVPWVSMWASEVLPVGRQFAAARQPAST